MEKIKFETPEVKEKPERDPAEIAQAELNAVSEEAEKTKEVLSEEVGIEETTSTQEQRDLKHGYSNREAAWIQRIKQKMNTLPPDLKKVITKIDDKQEIEPAEYGAVQSFIDKQKKPLREYWLQRLLPELDILPSDVQAVIKKKIQGESWDTVIGRGTFDAYVAKRTNILELNVAKRKEMEKLKRRLKKIDKKEDYPEDEIKKRRTIFYDEANKQLFIEEEKERKTLSFGDIVADCDWGIKYKPDQALPDQIWRRIRKLSDLTETRINVQNIFNKEIANTEQISLPTTSYSVEYLEQHPQAGVIAERMAKNMLVRLQYDQPDTNIRVEPSNAVEDAELKYDFKLFLPEKLRGVAIEGEDMSREKYVETKHVYGIQFTINQEPGILERKEKQIKSMQEHLPELKNKYGHLLKKSVDDVVLVQINFPNATRYFKKWIVEGKPSGGPEQYLSEQEKSDIIKAILRDSVALKTLEK